MENRKFSFLISNFAKRIKFFLRKKKLSIVKKLLKKEISFLRKNIFLRKSFSFFKFFFQFFEFFFLPEHFEEFWIASEFLLLFSRKGTETKKKNGKNSKKFKETIFSTKSSKKRLFFTFETILYCSEFFEFF